MHRRVFKPIYGWGWRQGDSSIEVPAPFELAITSGAGRDLRGTIGPPHQFAGRSAWLTLRSKDGDAVHWSVMLGDPTDPDYVSGSAESEDE